MTIHSTRGTPVLDSGTLRYYVQEDGSRLIPSNAPDLQASLQAAAADDKTIVIEGAHTVSATLQPNAIDGATFDLRRAVFTAAASLDATVFQLLNCTNCTVLGGVINGNSSGQAASSFGISLNGGSDNRVIGGEVTDCNTYGLYIIGCNRAVIEGVWSHDNQQAGIAGDVGSSDVDGVHIRNCIVQDNGLVGSGALSGILIEGNDGTGFYYTDLMITNIQATGNRGSGITLQNVRHYVLANINAWSNYIQGITLASCLYGSGGNFSLSNNDVGNSSGYENGLAIDDSGVTPASTQNVFVGVRSINHDGFSVIERGTAGGNVILGLISGDGGDVSKQGGTTSAFIKHQSTGLDFDGGKITVGEAEIDGDLNHDGDNVGFYGVAPVARPAAYTQTYATASRTHAARTAAALTNSLGDTTVNGTLETFSGVGTVSISALERNLSELNDQINKLRADQQNTAQVLNQLLDDLQSQGLSQ